ncbi:MAG: RDD family protein, partial [Planctomycetaceae bacterium]|nr:RDD family protein [Planctomycetaceae bacterium]
AMAYVIDGLLLTAMNGTVLGMIYYTVFSFDVDLTSQTAQIITAFVTNIPPMIVIGIYFVKNESGVEQTTAGKKAMHLFVAQDEKCQPITTGQAVKRYLFFVFLSCFLTAGIGILMAAFRKDRKTLHDLMSGTEVRMDKPKPKKPKEEPAQS